VNTNKLLSSRLDGLADCIAKHTGKGCEILPETVDTFVRILRSAAADAKVLENARRERDGLLAIACDFDSHNGDVTVRVITPPEKAGRDNVVPFRLAPRPLYGSAGVS